MPIISLPYQTDSTRLFDAIRHLPFACWLDSGKPHSHSGRYDIMTAAPSTRWVTETPNKMGDTTTQILHYDCTLPLEQLSAEAISISSSTEAPLSLLQSSANALTRQYQHQLLKHQNTHIDLPFYGGLIAYVSYDLGRENIGIPQRSVAVCDLPDMISSLYTWAIIQDHERQLCWLAALDECPSSLFTQLTHHFSQLLTKKPMAATAAAHLESHHKDNTFQIAQMQSNTSKPSYHQKIAHIHDYIQAGDCYQVNLSQCFSGEYSGDPYLAYRQLRQTMASPFSAFIDLGNHSDQHPRAILSLSPERFLSITQDKVLTQPIKGTIKRHSDKAIDKRNAINLQSSEKNQAENLMIVDLLRNDLGKSCIVGSIEVPRLYDLESYPNVHHLVSSVTGTITQDKTAIDVFRDCFPGGSITGAPKKRSMEIIEELEDCQRSIYCGSILYVNANGDMDSNITIRTLATNGDTLYCWGGGGIVADSEANDEYHESITKIGTILEVLRQYEHSTSKNNT